MSETAEWGNVCSRVDTCALTGAAAFFTGAFTVLSCTLISSVTFSFFFAMNMVLPSISFYLNMNINIFQLHLLHQKFLHLMPVRCIIKCMLKTV